MNDNSDQNVQVVQENIQVQPKGKKREMSKLGQLIVKIFQDLLNFNMITYTKEKAPRL